MEEIGISKWKEFPGALEDAAKRLTGARVESGIPDSLLYRGAAKACWGLETTLERRTRNRRMASDQYVMFALSNLREVEAVSGRQWEAPSGLRAIQKEIAAKESREPQCDPFWVHLPAYPYLVYLRQHGFPSPLLDWTRSPYIAAFFAFWQSSYGEDGRAAIHVFSERPDGVKGGSGGKPRLQVWGPHTSTHQRHFVQQALYTTATRWDSTVQRHYFVSHDELVGKSDARQDMCVKITLPRTERTEVMRWLSDVNINSYTLFQTEDSLIQAIESRVFDGDFEDLMERFSVPFDTPKDGDGG